MYMKICNVVNRLRRSFLSGRTDFAIIPLIIPSSLPHACDVMTAIDANNVGNSP